MTAVPNLPQLPDTPSPRKPCHGESKSDEVSPGTSPSSASKRKIAVRRPPPIAVPPAPRAPAVPLPRSETSFIPDRRAPPLPPPPAPLAQSPLGVLEVKLPTGTGGSYAADVRDGTMRISLLPAANPDVPMVPSAPSAPNPQPKKVMCAKCGRCVTAPMFVRENALNSFSYCSFGCFATHSA